MKKKRIRTARLDISGIELYQAVNSYVSTPVITGCRLWKKKGTWTISIKLTGAKKAIE